MSTLTDLSRELAAVVDSVSPLLVTVGTKESSGRTGVYLPSGSILTAAVDAVDGETVSVHAGAQAAGPSTAEVIAFDDSLRLAVLRPEHQPAAALDQPLTVPRLGELALTVARPSPEGVEAALGVVRCIGGPTQTGSGQRIPGYYQTDTIGFPGFAGAPVVGADGGLYGFSALEGRGEAPFVYPAEFLLQEAGRLEREGSPKVGYLGIHTQQVDITPAQQEALGTNAKSGLLVIGMDEGGPAESAGMLLGDLLVALQGEPVADHRGLLSIMRQHGPGIEVTAAILRGGSATELAVKLGERGGRRAWRSSRRGRR